MGPGKILFSILLFTVEIMITFNMFSFQTPLTNCSSSLSVVSSRVTRAVSATRTNTSAFASEISSSYITLCKPVGRYFELGRHDGRDSKVLEARLYIAKNAKNDYLPRYVINEFAQNLGLTPATPLPTGLVCKNAHT